jgi:transcriptional regulator with XRE-family HTH domain
MSLGQLVARSKPCYREDTATAPANSSNFRVSARQHRPQAIIGAAFGYERLPAKEEDLPISETSRTMIGPRLRHIRQEKGFTIETLAAAARLDKGFLSRLERGTKRPSIETVLRLSAALDVPVGQLFGEQTTNETVRISRSAGRRRSLEEPGNYSFELLSPKGGLMEGFLFHIGAEPSGSGQQHDGEELFYVISGTVEMRTPDRSYVLNAGDCAYFPGHVRHQMRQIGPEPATALIAVARERATVKRQAAEAALADERPA